MKIDTSQFTIAISVAWVLFAGSTSLTAQSVPDSMKPTATQSPQEMDKTWQNAGSKYDSPRKALLAEVDHIASAGPFRADWESLRSYQVPDWYKDAKFGIFIHWGVYSVPAFGSEWYPRMMYQENSPEYKHHLATYGPLTQFGYKDFIPRFKAEKFDANQWAALFEESGAKYVVPVFEHHDGFAMYDSGLSDWTVVKMGPRRDVYGELAKAIRAHGLHLGASSHRIEHNFFLDGGRKLDSDVNDQEYAAFYGPAHAWLEGKKTLLEDWTFLSTNYLDDWLARDAEIVEKYNPEILYFDWWIGQPNARRHVAKFASFYYNQAAAKGNTAVINYKDNAMEQHSGVLDVERGQLAGIRPLYWQTDTSISTKSWGYIENDNFKPAEAIIQQLADVVSKNGNLLVNIGPRSDGTIPEQAQATLREVGAWLKINGEAIYGTRPWSKFGEGPTTIVEGAFHDTETKPYTPQDFRFTTKGNVIYAIEMAPPETGESLVHSVDAGALAGKTVSSISVLGQTVSVGYQLQSDGLHLRIRAQTPTGKHALVYKIQLK